MIDTDFIRERLQALTPTYLEVLDESQQHIGHRPAQNGSEHFAVRISSPQFAGKKLLECHRLVYQALGAVVGKEIHALRIEIKN
jgi:BolA family transcriptional regulator, general stress-responsive regulator